MEGFFSAVAAFLLATKLAGLLRLLRGPAEVDRVQSVQLAGTTGVAILLLLAEAHAQPALRNVALVFAVLSVLMMVAFVRRELDSPVVLGGQAARDPSVEGDRP
jgi:multicomponent Na+:H+ antiporter subunit F